MLITNLIHWFLTIYISFIKTLKMGCLSDNQNAVHSYDLDIITVPTKLNKVLCLAGKFQRRQLPKEIWLSRMATMIYDHIKQVKGYGQSDYNIMLIRVAEFKKMLASHLDEKQVNAIKVMDKLFDKPTTPKVMAQTLINLSAEYCKKNKEHDFEEIMFKFSIIVNAPTMRYFETKY